MQISCRIGKKRVAKAILLKTCRPRCSCQDISKCLHIGHIAVRKVHKIRYYLCLLKSEGTYYRNKYSNSFLDRKGKITYTHKPYDIGNENLSGKCWMISFVCDHVTDRMIADVSFIHSRVNPFKKTE